MTFFDQLFFSCFKHYKPKYKQKANTIALFYISSLQCALLLLTGLLLAFFLKQMHTTSMSSDNAWLLFVLGCFIIIFKNWIQYSGKKRKIMNAKNLNNKEQLYSVWILWILLVGTILFSAILLQGL
ncbi:hypothetical protein ESY86_08375 [Subsaximicrobium wynnwilliamsii]|jgi:O-antigen/teichoic acid export membrane protein|uniref:Uncharacterized protein n=1 Tax=Subsaximicrobium wynnwilliamsii TaxID=291179 RepID=A0A5C6ZGY0_9FLAO|nr:hypothetical protein [Subsaximicrobium wynnwilliamsii]TXD83721.1 hypothetical protein ESY87_08830 [Subsaximicrobium wynnwilliamsii]TXD89395.1 hypothetical protein ESY86_08375 [Subsaximicrobium wynnwilliamsii]TXE03558.1 hypothetical protein ESY88_07855 [Subsaximicrobium wynnwilliamsii]